MVINNYRPGIFPYQYAIAVKQGLFYAPVYYIPKATANVWTNAIAN